MPIHAELESVHKGSYPTDTDPGAVGAGRFWTDLSVGPPYQLKVRNADNTGWQNVGVISAGHGGGGGGGGTLQNEALVSQGASVTASSADALADPGGTADQPPSQAIDDNDETEWWIAPGETPIGSWLQVDLGSAKTITTYRIKQPANSGYRATSLKIQKSDDTGTTWDDVVTLDTVIDTGQVALDAPVTSQLWRAICTGAPILTLWGLATFGLYSGASSDELGNLTWMGPWDSATDYVVGDLVSDGGSSYIAIAASTNQEPPNATYWDVLAAKGDDGSAGLVWRGAWASGTAYVLNDVVEDAGSSYVCILAHTGHEPPNATYWDVLAAGATDVPAVENAALSGTATASTQDVNVASRANDDDPTGTHWSSTDPGTGSWLQIDLGLAREIDQFQVLQNGSSGTRANFKVQSSTDGGTTWTDQATVTGNPIDTTVTDLTAPVTAQIWRLLGTSGAAGHWEVHEFRLFGPPLPPTVGHIIENEGSPVTQRANLNFVGDGVAVTDDSGADATVVTISGGGGGGGTGSGYMVPFTVPPTTGWGWLNQGTATANTTDDVLVMSDDAPGGGNQFRGYEQTVAVPFSVTMLIVANNTPIAYATAGIYMRHSGGEILAAHFQYNAGQLLRVWDWQSDLTTVSEILNTQVLSSVVWLRISDDGTTVEIAISLDGRHFGVIYSAAHNAVVTDPDRVGIMVNAVDHESSVSLLSWDAS